MAVSTDCIPVGKKDGIPDDGDDWHVDLQSKSQHGEGSLAGSARGHIVSVDGAHEHVVVHDYRVCEYTRSCHFHFDLQYRFRGCVD